MDKSSIIKLKEQGYSNRKVEKMLNINRKTIAKYWNEYQANIASSVVNKYGFIQIENNFYSVPEYLVGRKVTSKIYYNKILVYSDYELICEHKKIDGTKKNRIKRSNEQKSTYRVHRSNG